MCKLFVFIARPTISYIWLLRSILKGDYIYIYKKKNPQPPLFNYLAAILLKIFKKSVSGRKLKEISDINNF